jgi:CRP-like cAMP-binding protein
MPLNHLLRRLPSAEARLLTGLGKPVALEAQQAWASRGHATRTLLFPESGCLALTVPMDAHAPLGLQLVGREGSIGAHSLLGQSASPTGAQVQASGTAFCIAAPRLGPHWLALPNLRRLLLRDVQAQWAQAAQAAACQRFHSLEQRLARWLLMSFDRADGLEVHLTHDELARRLGVRRAGVTVAAGRLQRVQAIHIHRGLLTLTDRSRLVHAACTCLRGGAWPQRP